MCGGGGGSGRGCEILLPVGAGPVGGGTLTPTQVQGTLDRIGVLHPPPRWDRIWGHPQTGPGFDSIRRRRYASCSYTGLSCFQKAYLLPTAFLITEIFNKF